MLALRFFCTLHPQSKAVSQHTQSLENSRSRFRFGYGESSLNNSLEGLLDSGCKEPRLMVEAEAE